MKTSAAAGMACCCFLFASAVRGDDGLKLSLSLSTPTGAAVSMPRPAVVPRAAFAGASVMDYRIGTEDLLEIKVFGVDQLSSTVRVDARGIISMPLIGMVPIAGLTVPEAQAAITARLAESYLQNPQVSVFIKEFTTQRVTIEGAVNRPGIYPLKGQTTLLIALALAGGQGRFSEMNEVVIFRTDATGKRLATIYDVERIRRGEIEDPAVLNEDLVVVNRSPGRVAIRDSFLGDLFDIVNPFRYVPTP
jgi:polysaccharide biosynthesis/export protein